MADLDNTQLLSESVLLESLDDTPKVVAVLTISGKSFELFNRDITLGRKPECDIVVNSAGISGLHAVFEYSPPDAHFIYDSRSTNKTKLDKDDDGNICPKLWSSCVHEKRYQLLGSEVFQPTTRECLDLPVNSFKRVMKNYMKQKGFHSNILKPFIRYKVNDGSVLQFGNVVATYHLCDSGENENMECVPLSCTPPQEFKTPEHKGPPEDASDASCDLFDSPNIYDVDTQVSQSPQQADENPASSNVFALQKGNHAEIIQDSDASVQSSSDLMRSADVEGNMFQDSTIEGDVEEVDEMLTSVTVNLDKPPKPFNSSPSNLSIPLTDSKNVEEGVEEPAAPSDACPEILQEISAEQVEALIKNNEPVSELSVEPLFSPLKDDNLVGIVALQNEPIKNTDLNGVNNIENIAQTNVSAIPLEIPPATNDLISPPHSEPRVEGIMKQSCQDEPSHITGLQGERVTIRVTKSSDVINPANDLIIPPHSGHSIKDITKQSSQNGLEDKQVVIGLTNSSGLAPPNDLLNANTIMFLDQSSLISAETLQGSFDYSVHDDLQNEDQELLEEPRSPSQKSEKDVNEGSKVVPKESTDVSQIRTKCIENELPADESSQDTSEVPNWICNFPGFDTSTSEFSTQPAKNKETLDPPSEKIHVTVNENLLEITDQPCNDQQSDLLKSSVNENTEITKENVTNNSVSKVCTFVFQLSASKREEQEVRSKVVLDESISDLFTQPVKETNLDQSVDKSVNCAPLDSMSDLFPQSSAGTPLPGENKSLQFPTNHANLTNDRLITNNSLDDSMSDLCTQPVLVGTVNQHHKSSMDKSNLGTRSCLDSSISDLCTQPVVSKELEFGQTKLTNQILDPVAEYPSHVKNDESLHNQDHNDKTELNNQKPDWDTDQQPQIKHHKSLHLENVGLDSNISDLCTQPVVSDDNSVKVDLHNQTSSSVTNQQPREKHSISLHCRLLTKNIGELNSSISDLCTQPVDSKEDHNENDFSNEKTDSVHLKHHKSLHDRLLNAQVVDLDSSISDLCTQPVVLIGDAYDKTELTNQNPDWNTHKQPQIKHHRLLHHENIGDLDSSISDLCTQPVVLKDDDSDNAELPNQTSDAVTNQQPRQKHHISLHRRLLDKNADDLDSSLSNLCTQPVVSHDDDSDQKKATYQRPDIDRNDHLESSLSDLCTQPFIPLEDIGLATEESNLNADSAPHVKHHNPPSHLKPKETLDMSISDLCTQPALLSEQVGPDQDKDVNSGQLEESISDICTQPARQTDKMEKVSSNVSKRHSIEDLPPQIKKQHLSSLLHQTSNSEANMDISLSELCTQPVVLIEKLDFGQSSSGLSTKPKTHASTTVAHSTDTDDFCDLVKERLVPVGFKEGPSMTLESCKNTSQLNDKLNPAPETRSRESFVSNNIESNDELNSNKSKGDDSVIANLSLSEMLTQPSLAHSPTKQIQKSPSAFKRRSLSTKNALRCVKKVVQETPNDSSLKSESQGSDILMPSVFPHHNTKKKAQQDGVKSEGSDNSSGLTYTKVEHSKTNLENKSKHVAFGHSPEKEQNVQTTIGSDANEALSSSSMSSKHVTLSKGSPLKNPKCSSTEDVLEEEQTISVLDHPDDSFDKLLLSSSYGKAKCGALPIKKPIQQYHNTSRAGSAWNSTLDLEKILFHESDSDNKECSPLRDSKMTSKGRNDVLDSDQETKTGRTLRKMRGRPPKKLSQDFVTLEPRATRRRRGRPSKQQSQVDASKEEIAVSSDQHKRKSSSTEEKEEVGLRKRTIKAVASEKPPINKESEDVSAQLSLLDECHNMIVSLEKTREALTSLESPSKMSLSGTASESECGTPRVRRSRRPKKAKRQHVIEDFIETQPKGKRTSKSTDDDDEELNPIKKSAGKDSDSNDACNPTVLPPCFEHLNKTSNGQTKATIESEPPSTPLKVTPRKSFKLFQKVTAKKVSNAPSQPTKIEETSAILSAPPVSPNVEENINKTVETSNKRKGRERNKLDDGSSNNVTVKKQKVKRDNAKSSNSQIPLPVASHADESKPKRSTRGKRPCPTALRSNCLEDSANILSISPIKVGSESVHCEVSNVIFSAPSTSTPLSIKKPRRKAKESNLPVASDQLEESSKLALRTSCSVGGNSADWETSKQSSFSRTSSRSCRFSTEHVMFTGYSNDKLFKIVKSLGGEIVESPETCTVLVTDQVRRTVKFLCCLAQGLPIVSPRWLTKSEEAKAFLDPHDFLLEDAASEEKFSFKLSTSIEKASSCKFLDGWSFVVTPSVRPPVPEMKLIIECSGGRVKPRFPVKWDDKFAVISCLVDQSKWKKFKKADQSPPIVSPEAILLGVLHQEMTLHPYSLASPPS